MKKKTTRKPKRSASSAKKKRVTPKPKRSASSAKKKRVASKSKRTVRAKHKKAVKKKTRKAVGKKKTGHRKRISRKKVSKKISSVSARPAKASTGFGKKIFKKKLSGKKFVRVPSGIPGFDKLCSGGFIDNTSNILVGATGSGKTIFAVQSVIDGMKRGESCLYITFEEKKEQFYKNMKMFGWDLESYEKKGLFNFLEYTPQKVKIMLEEGGGIIESIVFDKKIKRMVIDSISSFTLLFKDELEKRASSLELFNMLRKWDCTTILTLEEDPCEELNPDAKSIQFESDSTINLYFIRDKQRRGRQMEILKMRGTDHSKAIYPFTITNKGIAVGTRPIKGVKC